MSHLPFLQGFYAFHIGLGARDCPYVSGPYYLQWQSGFKAGYAGFHKVSMSERPAPNYDGTKTFATVAHTPDNSGPGE